MNNISSIKQFYYLIISLNNKKYIEIRKNKQSFIIKNIKQVLKNKLFIKVRKKLLIVTIIIIYILIR